MMGNKFVVGASRSLVVARSQDAVLRGHATRSPEVRLTHYVIPSNLMQSTTSTEPH